MKIENVKIYGLWDKYNFNWDLNSTVNILSGINGSGKTTILDAIAGLCLVGKYPKSISKNFKSVEIQFSNNYKIRYLRVKDSYINLKQRAKKEVGLNEIVDNIKKDLSGNLSKINQLKIEAGITYASKNGKKCNVEEVLEKLKLSIVSTFDQPLHKDDDAIKISELKNNEIITELDWEIYGLQEEYLNYQVNIGKKIESILLDGDNDIKKEIEDIYYKKNIFKKIVNELFEETGKTIDESNNRISFQWNDKKTLSPYQLSSGEKQLLIIILKALLQDEKEFIFFMDEPEISLHIDWQKVLLHNIRKLNPNCQIIISSHSPAMIMDGWLDKVSDVSDLISNSN